MAQREKSAYCAEPERRPARIEGNCQSRGAPNAEAEKRAWATVNKNLSGSDVSGSGRGKAETKSASRNHGTRGVHVSAPQMAEERSASAKTAVATRKSNLERSHG